MRTLIIKAMSDFMTDNGTDSTIIQSPISEIESMELVDLKL